MTAPIMEVGRWAVQRNGSVTGPLRMNPDSVYQWACGDDTYTDAGQFIASRTLSSNDDIIATFPTCAEAKAYARNLITGTNTGAEEPAPTVDWEQRRWDAALAAPEPPEIWWGNGMKCASGYAQWNVQYADALIAALKGETK